MENKRVTAYTASFFVDAIPLFLLYGFIGRKVYTWGTYALYLLGCFLFLHFVVAHPVGLFAKYEIENDQIKVTDLLKRTSLLFFLQDEKLHVYRYSGMFFVLSYEPIASKHAAKQKMREGKAGFLLRNVKILAAVDHLERDAQQLK